MDGWIDDTKSTDAVKTLLETLAPYAHDAMSSSILCVCEVRAEWCGARVVWGRSGMEAE